MHRHIYLRGLAATACGAALLLLTVTAAQAQPANGAPMAAFTWYPRFPSYTEKIAFDASASLASGGEIVKYLWDFGDGTTAEGKNVTHTYEHDGNFNVTLTVVDGRNVPYAAVNAVTLYDTGR